MGRQGDWEPERRVPRLNGEFIGLFNGYSNSRVVWEHFGLKGRQAIWQVMRTFCGDGVSKVRSLCVASQPYLIIITGGLGRRTGRRRREIESSFDLPDPEVDSMVWK